MVGNNEVGFLPPSLLILFLCISKAKDLCFPQIVHINFIIQIKISWFNLELKTWMILSCNLLFSFFDSGEMNAIHLLYCTGHAILFHSN